MSEFWISTLQAAAATRHSLNTSNWSSCDTKIQKIISAICEIKTNKQIWTCCISANLKNNPFYPQNIQFPSDVVLRATSSLGMYLVSEAPKWYGDALTTLWRHNTKRTLTTYMPHYTHSGVYNNPMLPDAHTHSHPCTHTGSCMQTNVCARSRTHTPTHKHAKRDLSDVMGSVRQEVANI